MKESTVRYVCRECGHVETKWNGRCPECGSWNSFDEESVSVQLKGSKTDEKSVMDNEVRKLSDVPFEPGMRVTSGLDELDRILGGGVMRPSSVLVGGEPGIGKSTIMIQMLSSLSEKDSVLYVSGEESPSQVRLRSERLGLSTSSISIFCDTRLEALSSTIERIKPGYIVIDSLQTLYSVSISSIAGSPNQIFIAHVTKDGTIAGPKIVEHIVDTVLYFESAESGLRLLRASKNRFGSVDEIGLFTMDEKGLHGLKDPSSVFLSSRAAEGLPSGIAFTPAVEGSRTFAVEIQALVVPAKTGLQRIYSDRIDNARVSRVAAILQKHAGLMLADQDIYVNVAGGIKLSDVTIELALALALYSSKEDIPLSPDLAAFGELSLAGEVRPVQFAERRIRTLSEMGFRKVLSADSNDGRLIAGKPVSDIKAALIAALAFSGAVCDCCTSPSDASHRHSDARNPLPSVF